MCVAYNIACIEFDSFRPKTLYISARLSLLVFADANYWIGLTDRDSEGQWVWHDTDNAPTYTDWLVGQPDNSKANEDCALFWKGHGYQWNDANCDYRAEPICEIRQEKIVIWAIWGFKLLPFDHKKCF